MNSLNPCTLYPILYYRQHTEINRENIILGYRPCSSLASYSIVNVLSTTQNVGHYRGDNVGTV